MILIVRRQVENESIMLGCLEGFSAVRVVAVPADGEDLLADDPSLAVIDTQTFREDECPQVTLLSRDIARSRNGVPVLIYGTLRYVMQNDHSLKKWGDVSGRSIDDLTLSDTLKYIWKAEANRCLAGEIIRSEYRTEEEGELRSLESIISPVTVDGDVQGILSITKDVSEYRSTEELLNTRKIKLEETNTAPRVILKKRADDKKEIEERVLNNLYSVVYPYLSLIAAKAKEG